MELSPSCHRSSCLPRRCNGGTCCRLAMSVGNRAEADQIFSNDRWRGGSSRRLRSGGSEARPPAPSLHSAHHNYVGQKSKLKYNVDVPNLLRLHVAAVYLILCLLAAGVEAESPFGPYPPSRQQPPGQRGEDLRHPPPGFSIPRLLRRQGLVARTGARSQQPQQLGQLTNLEKGPLTLVNGQLRPVMDDTDDRSYYPQQENVHRPFKADLEPEIHITRLPASGVNFNPDTGHDHHSSGSRLTNTADRRVDGGRGGGPRPRPVNKGIIVPQPGGPFSSPTSAGPVRPDAGDWSTRVNKATDSKQDIVLDTKYFSITYPDLNVAAGPAVTADPGLMYVTGKPGLVLRKVKGKMKTSTANPLLAVSSTVRLEAADPCENSVLECANSNRGVAKSNTNNNSTARLQPPTFPTYQDLIKHFRQEVWVIPVLAAAGLIILILIVFEIFLLAKAINRNPSRRHLFLGQMLLLGLLSCAGMSVVYTLKPSVVSCAVIRLGSGLSYSVVYSTLLVKLVFLVSLNSGVYLPATYQSLLLCFAVLIQLVIGIQWLVSAPPEVIDLPIGDSLTMVTCGTLFKQQLLGLLYVVFLIVVVVLLAFKSRGVRENYREAIYVGLTMGFTVAIWMVWVLAGLIVPYKFQDVCTACGMIACTSITFVIMFMPKGRQLSAMGKEGLYAEDRTEVYTGSGTGSTGSSGTPSPSFFPVKPGKIPRGLEDIKERERLDTPTSSHRHLQRYTGRPEDSMYNSLEVLNSDRFPYKSKPSRSNPNVLFRRPNDMPSQIIY